ncbi:hypothetical protein HanPSC8_Chr05g0216381 [Helianthus annuus]|nr:hypothetical protein HanPSC8_Chr05g0216381 [Helianthus annuus]
MPPPPPSLPCTDLVEGNFSTGSFFDISITMLHPLVWKVLQQPTWCFHVYF